MLGLFSLATGDDQFSPIDMFNRSEVLLLEEQFMASGDADGVIRSEESECALRSCEAGLGLSEIPTIDILHMS